MQPKVFTLVPVFVLNVHEQWIFYEHVTMHTFGVKDDRKCLPEVLLEPLWYFQLTPKVPQWNVRKRYKVSWTSHYWWPVSSVGLWHQCLHFLLDCRVHLTLFYSFIHLLAYFMIPKRPCSVFITLSLKCIIYCAFIICLVCLCVWMRTTITGLYLCVAIQINEMK